MKPQPNYAKIQYWCFGAAIVISAIIIYELFYYSFSQNLRHLSLASTLAGASSFLFKIGHRRQLYWITALIVSMATGTLLFLELSGTKPF